MARIGALTRYHLELLLRSHAWLPPFLAYALLMVVGVAAGDPLLGSLGLGAGALLPVSAWYVRSVLGAEPPASRACLVAAAGPVRVHLGALLAALPEAYHAGVDDVLLSGLTAALDEWLRARGRPVPDGFLIDREAHGRVPLDESMDLTRTVGWFTAVHPVWLETGPVDPAEVRAGGEDAARLIKRVKEQLRQRPGDGLGFGLLRYLNPATSAVLEPLAAPQIGFNYLGRFGGSGPDADAGGGGGPVPAGAGRGGARPWTPAAGHGSPEGGVDASMPLRHVLEINGAARDLPEGPELRFVLESPRGLLTGEELGDLAERWQAVLEGLVRHASEGPGGHTPSDFSLISLGQEDIDEFESAFGGAAGD
ncbi:condensation domain-containing protein [Streptomyces sp. CBMA156]|uniref:condensation domain-containing protein n=1 Tax=Streptomyces sp. CBMA156 TaxID=1930280 RepID=UPI001661A13B|nr:condensation domain-containing protein [Streptomyces sp. CBMA156]MBD0669590.1 hypothetical protein [Streptomyces sp. CBMA156]